MTLMNLIYLKLNEASWGLSSISSFKQHVHELFFLKKKMGQDHCTKIIIHRNWLIRALAHDSAECMLLHFTESPTWMITEQGFTLPMVLCWWQWLVVVWVKANFFLISCCSCCLKSAPSSLDHFPLSVHNDFYFDFHPGTRQIMMVVFI